jgi:hypothetical protein
MSLLLKKAPVALGLFSELEPLYCLSVMRRVKKFAEYGI